MRNFRVGDGRLFAGSIALFPWPGATAHRGDRRFSRCEVITRRAAGVQDVVARREDIKFPGHATNPAFPEVRGTLGYLPSALSVRHGFSCIDFPASTVHRVGPNDRNHRTGNRFVRFGFHDLPGERTSDIRAVAAGCQADDCECKKKLSQMTAKTRRARRSRVR